MRKFLLASVAVAGLAGSTFALNAFAAPGDGPDAVQTQHRHENRAAMLDADLDGVKTGLNLTPDQLKTWPAFEAAIRDAAKARAEARHETREHRADGERPSPIDRMNKMADRLQKKSAELKMIADASKPLYDSLTDEQKREFGPMVHEFVGRGHEGGEHRHHGGGEGGDGSEHMQ
jgi:hypothetical protein